MRACVNMCVCVCACVRACVRAYVHACMRACVRVRKYKKCNILIKSLCEKLRSIDD